MGKSQPRELPGRAAKRFKAQKIADVVKFVLAGRIEVEWYKSRSLGLFSVLFYASFITLMLRRRRTDFVKPSTMMVRKV